MYWFRFAVLVVVLTVLQASLVDAIAVSNLNIKPHLLLIGMVFFACYSNTYDTILASFIIGFASDLIGPIMGPGIISFGISGTLLAYLRRAVTINKMPYQAAVIFVTGLFAGVLYYYLSLFKAPASPANASIFIFWIPLYSAILGPFLFLPLAWWMRIKTQRFGRQ